MNPNSHPYVHQPQWRN